jgi:hypothetical protein
MHQLMTPIFIVGTLFALTANAVLRCRMKLLLREREHPTSFYHSHHLDFGEMRKLIQAETDPGLRRRYSLLLKWCYITPVILLGFGAGLFYVMAHGP